jgi:UDP-N-acetylglucosamine 2-epimerase
MKLLFICGTRPEAIKLAPVISEAKRRPDFDVTLCVTGQHREMLDQVNQLFGLTPDFDLALMKPGQDLTHVMASALVGIGPVIDQVRPDWLVVQGDTTTAFAGALAALYRKVPVAHVEAGLRTGNLLSPWPEEANRRMISPLTRLHFAPTARAAANLCAEAIAGSAMLVTGNTVIDALQQSIAKLETDAALRAQATSALPALDPARRLLLVTGHRRENLDQGLANLCRALCQLAGRGDVQIIYPVHLNPAVQTTVRSLLGDHPAVHLLPPLDYLSFIWLMSKAHLILTDSGGIQEEAPALGKPVLVIRDSTERPEAIEAGTALLVGTAEEAIRQAAAQLLDDPARYQAMAHAANPFGDGQASVRIIDALTKAGANQP